MPSLIPKQVVLVYGKAYLTYYIKQFLLAGLVNAW